MPAPHAAPEMRNHSDAPGSATRSPSAPWQAGSDPHTRPRQQAGLHWQQARQRPANRPLTRPGSPLPWQQGRLAGLGAGAHLDGRQHPAALVVAHTSAPEPPAANLRLEGRRGPQRRRVGGGLDVVVAVDQGGGGAGRGVQEVGVQHGAGTVGGQDPHILPGERGATQTTRIDYSSSMAKPGHILRLHGMAGPKRTRCSQEANQVRRSSRATDLKAGRHQPMLQPGGGGQQIAMIIRQRRHRGNGGKLQQVSVVGLIALGPAPRVRVISS